MLGCVSNRHLNTWIAVMSEGVGRGHTRVVCSTLASRGKSFTPESRIEMLESRRCIDDWSEETQEARGEERDIVDINSWKTR